MSRCQNHTCSLPHSHSRTSHVRTPGAACSTFELVPVDSSRQPAMHTRVVHGVWGNCIAGPAHRCMLPECPFELTCCMPLQVTAIVHGPCIRAKFLLADVDHTVQRPVHLRHLLHSLPELCLIPAAETGMQSQVWECMAVCSMLHTCCSRPGAPLIGMAVS